MLSLEEPELEYKENGEHNHHRRNLHALFARNGEVVKKVDENVAEYAKHQAVTNGIGERHHDDGRKCRYTFGDVVDIDVFDILEHEITNINQRWCVAQLGTATMIGAKNIDATKSAPMVMAV